ncbi:hypothetical protein F5I97DRAFT_1860373 [Phlebopus sp. FC_14]|nr:hypothetical protein F5I97DRAFT_1860373 [Phlebopus sp. FC_14]
MKGVASVPSPVCNLAQCITGVKHRSFIDPFMKSFRQAHGMTKRCAFWLPQDRRQLNNSDGIAQPCLVDETSECLEDKYFKFGMAGLPVRRF